MTFTVEDALLSPISFSMLSGAGVVKGGENETVHVHMTTSVNVDAAIASDNTGLDAGTLYVDLEGAVGSADICETAPIFIMQVESDGSLTGTSFTPGEVKANKDGKKCLITINDTSVAVATTVMVDYYILRKSSRVTELQIDTEKFGGYFYVEADTLFRAQIDGKDYPANITLPNVKIQSNWTFTMAATGDPSTFSFTMDAMPGFTYFDNTKKVLCVIQVVEDVDDTETELKTVMGHKADEVIEKEGNIPWDSVPNAPTGYTEATEYAADTVYYIVGSDGKAVLASSDGKLTETAYNRLKNTNRIYTKNA